MSGKGHVEAFANNKSSGNFNGVALLGLLPFIYLDFNSCTLNTLL